MTMHFHEEPPLQLPPLLPEQPGPIEQKDARDILKSEIAALRQKQRACQNELASIRFGQWNEFGESDEEVPKKGLTADVRKQELLQQKEQLITDRINLIHRCKDAGLEVWVDDANDLHVYEKDPVSFQALSEKERLRRIHSWEFTIQEIDIQLEALARQRADLLSRESDTAVSADAFHGTLHEDPAFVRVDERDEKRKESRLSDIDLQQEWLNTFRRSRVQALEAIQKRGVN